MYTHTHHACMRMCMSVYYISLNVSFGSLLGPLGDAAGGEDWGRRHIYVHTYCIDYINSVYICIYIYTHTYIHIHTYIHSRK